MKTYPVLKYAQRHEDVLRSGNIGLFILNLGVRWRWVVSQLHAPAGLDVVVKRKNPSPCWGSNTGLPTHGSVTVLSEPVVRWEWRMDHIKNKWTWCHSKGWLDSLCCTT